MKAGEIIDRIKKNLGAPWRDATYRDTFKSGGAGHRGHRHRDHRLRDVRGRSARRARPG